MHKTLEFSDAVRLIEERVAAFCEVVAAAPDLGATVPTCPDWTLFDLAQHIGQSRRFWAMNLAAGAADAPSAEAVAVKNGAAPQEREALVAWIAEGARQQVAALREAGPEGECWTWWAGSQSPRNAGGLARHQLQEIAMHTYDAHLTVGDPQPLPEEIAYDGADEFLHTCCSTSVAWPFEPAILDYHVEDGRSWRLTLSGEGVRVSEVGPEPADLTGRASAGQLVLSYYGRVGIDALELEGDRTVLERLVHWDPSA
ncbi:maleylpyruvate isomerase family mycothiol-dependent enzyme [Kitasatospora sp. NPDC101183]|uniref:maleylpyruvate isomerase family mycothiol-dependent enzyme n=1 Tax=Kitasatospora sp. NPDC101183 TaxID=3364100 RepID=UPI003809D6A8